MDFFETFLRDFIISPVAPMFLPNSLALFLSSSFSFCSFFFLSNLISGAAISIRINIASRDDPIGLSVIRFPAETASSPIFLVIPNTVATMTSKIPRIVETVSLNGEKPCIIPISINTKISHMSRVTMRVCSVGFSLNPKMTFVYGCR